MGRKYLGATPSDPADLARLADLLSLNVDAFGADPTGAADSLAAINAAMAAVVATGRRGSVSLLGTYALTDTLNAVSGVDVIGNNSTIIMTKNGVGAAVLWSDITNSTWQDLNIYRRGSTTSGGIAGYITGNGTDNTCRILRVNCYSEVTSSFTGEGKFNGIFIGQYCAPSPYLEDCIGKAVQSGVPNTYLNDGIDVHVVVDLTTNTLGTPTLVRCTGIAGFGAMSSGIVSTESNAAEFIDCTGIGGIGKDGWALNDGSPTLRRCKGIAGVNVGTGTPSGLWLRDGGAPIMIGCEGIQSKSVTSHALQLSGTTAPRILDFYGHPPEDGLQWTYAAANNGRFRPFATPDYGLRVFSVWVHAANLGVTLDVGTTVGGHEIAQAINIGAEGSTGAIAWTPVAIAAGGYLYATPSSAIADGDLFIYYTAVYGVASNRTFEIDTVGSARVSRSTFEGFTQDGYSIPVSISATSAATKNWRLDNCISECLVTTTGRGLYADAAITQAPIYGIRVINSVDLHNITSFADAVELDYIELTTYAGISATTEGTADVFLTGNAVTYDGSTTIMVELFIPWVQLDGTANTELQLVLFDGATSLGLLGKIKEQSAAGRTPVSASRRLTPSAGSHTYAAAAFVDAHTSYVVGDAGGAGNGVPIFLRVTRVT